MRVFDSDISVLVISIEDCIVYSVGLATHSTSLPTAGLEALLAADIGSGLIRDDQKGLFFATHFDAC
jgi:hypothetical protein